MSTSPPATESPDEAESEKRDFDELRASIETLEDENEHLRRELERARRTRYRRTAIGLALLGLVGLGGAAVFPGVRTVLVALGATGLFAALLTYYLTPERFVAATVSERVYTALASTLESIVADLELSETRLYVPVDGSPAVRLYVPETPGAEPPDSDALRAPFVVADPHRGLSTRPTGDGLRAEFEAASDPPPDAVEPLVAAGCDALVEQFELVDAADSDIETDDGRATIRVTNPAFGNLDSFDHPVVSFLATMLANELEEPITVEIDDDERAGRLVTCRWETGG